MQNSNLKQSSSKTQNPHVSIALCTYNGDRFLQEQIESILLQTYVNISLVIVDDFSTDNTRLILSEYSGLSRCQIYYNDRNIGSTKSFEKCISLCTGDIIALSDQDDIWELFKIERMLGAHGDNTLLYHDSQLFSADDPGLSEKVSDTYNFVKGECNLSFIFKNCIPGHSMMFK